MRILECDAGYILEELDQKLSPHGYMVPLDLGAKGSCLIGGNVSTCAGGVRLLRYGSMHANILGLTVILPDEKGTIIKMGNGLRKDNTSLHSHHLFIGSEGQLGIISRIQLLVAPRPTSINSAFLGIENFQKVTDILRKAKTELSEILSSFELMDSETLKCLEENDGLKSVLPSNPAFAVLIETSGSSKEHDSEKFSKFLESVLENGLAADGVLAESSTEAASFWKLRETAPLSVMKDGYCYKNDISLPLKHFYELTDILRERLGNKCIRVTNYGHVGDGNAHINITSKSYDEELYKMIYPFLYEWVAKHGGSISAEHGIGQLKRPYLHLGKHPNELLLNQRLKQIFDPRGILNPYKMIDSL
uniref:D-2-hydroxyglutarate dehydrogenase, mitochondrial n=1 Tax=Panagrolaimus davidi TaxID=227884 RepID=A0A914PB02_9BILA